MNPEEKNAPPVGNDDQSANKAEIEPLSDQALEEVAGGASSDSCCSCSSCSKLA
ncbi:MAG TPA: hypothetical protein VIB39_23515 [Candidatus Angelobacter sp.]|jgi:hypothetical protein